MMGVMSGDCLRKQLKFCHQSLKSLKFSNSHDQDTCAELKHDIGIDQDPFIF